ncbi:MAG TPA: pentapeptide repeat-containing protein [Stellaceae bacterium]|jgi:hypothetical protein|nr:pentapeptide repeat-containing protein [Stellaceae bacterium]
MKFAIPFLRWTGKAALEIEIPDDTDKAFRLKVAVEIAVKNGASLVGASLVGASLDGARLDGARLVGASLDGASLVGASLDGASLVGASLVGARLDGASLVGASLDGARLDGASLVGASLDGARLDGARLVGASLDGASLRSIRADLFDVLLRAKPEVPALLAALREGRIDGSTYSGTCACLAGTIAKTRHVTVRDLGFSDASRPAERWFLGIRPGDTPEKHQMAKITEGWIVEFMGLAGIAGTEIA